MTSHERDNNADMLTEVEVICTLYLFFFSFLFFLPFTYCNILVFLLSFHCFLTYVSVVSPRQSAIWLL